MNTRSPDRNELHGARTRSSAIQLSMRAISSTAPGSLRRWRTSLAAAWADLSARAAGSSSPIWKSLRSRDGLTVISTVPTAAQKAGDFAFAPIYDPFTIAATPSGIFERQPFPNNRIPPSLFSPAGEKLLALYPDPNLPGIADNYRYSPSALHNAGWFHGRSDKRFSAQHNLSVSAGYEHEREQSPGALPAPAGLPFAQGSAEDAHVYTADENLNAIGSDAVAYTNVSATPASIHPRNLPLLTRWLPRCPFCHRPRSAGPPGVHAGEHRRETSCFNQ